MKTNRWNYCGWRNRRVEATEVVLTFMKKCRIEIFASWKTEGSFHSSRWVGGPCQSQRRERGECRRVKQIKRWLTKAAERCFLSFKGKDEENGESKLALSLSGHLWNRVRPHSSMKFWNIYGHLSFEESTTCPTADSRVAGREAVQETRTKICNAKCASEENCMGGSLERICFVLGRPRWEKCRSCPPTLCDPHIPRIASRGSVTVTHWSHLTPTSVPHVDNVERISVDGSPGAIRWMDAMARISSNLNIDYWPKWG